MVVNCSFLLIGSVWMLFLLVPQLMSSWKGMNDCAGVFVSPTVAFSSPCVCEVNDSEDCLCVCVCFYLAISLFVCASLRACTRSNMIRPEVGIQKSWVNLDF